MRLLLAAVLTCGLTACAARKPLDLNHNADLRSAQRTFQITVASADAAQEVIRAFAKDGLLSPEQAKVMLSVADHVEEVARNAGTAVGKLEALTPEDRQNIAKNVAIILEAVENSESQLHLIQNEKVRRVIQASLLGLKISLAAVG